MPRFDDIYEIAADNYGVITSAEARQAGVTTVEMARFVSDGRLERIGQGVYRLTRHIPTHLDQYAVAVALAGPGSYIHGESVLAMHNLALVNPMKTSVAVIKRTRRTLPKWISIVAANRSDTSTAYEGIPSQSVTDAILYCKRSVMKERLLDAVHAAVREGLIRQVDEVTLREELEK